MKGTNGVKENGNRNITRLKKVLIQELMRMECNVIGHKKRNTELMTACKCFTRRFAH